MTVETPESARVARAALSAAASGEALNRACFCFRLDQDALARALESELGPPGLLDLVRERCPHVFAAQPVFVSPVHLRRMADVVRAVEAVAAMPAYRERVLASAAPIARHDPGAAGVFYGYDFHLEGDRLGLIEINTNAGGAMLNAVLARAQRACCPAMLGVVPTAESVTALERSLVAMFRNEWQRAGRAAPLRRVAIVDQAPEQQYLYPEFLLFRRLFERHGIGAVIADPAQLTLRAGRLWHGDVAIDLVYNRLTDFMLETPASAALREAYLQDLVVLTPHPRAHALYADKRNLALLGDAAELQALGVPPALQAVLREGIPRAELVTPANAERLWSERRGLFFKPAAGFGSRAAYRGDKLTRRVWQEILAGLYVAQEVVAPGQRVVESTGNGEPGPALKFDLRNYVYEGRVLWVAARLYQGQTTNFRTPGGGFAPVYRSVS
jgi:hypothetical protein